ncbi:unnamed protein product [marine sediment metagenome]|uniref:Uncharacterized protein n=1 Tax=marine sediment metagenome TaxID=412755 RepID=X0VZ84_9ZZZZ
MSSSARMRKRMENNYPSWEEEQKKKKAQKTLYNWDEEEEDEI